MVATKLEKPVIFDQYKFRLIQKSRPDVVANINTAHSIIIDKCPECGGSGFNPITHDACHCIQRFQDAEQLLYTGAPLEILEIRNIQDKRHNISDFQYKPVRLSLEPDEIKIVNRKRWFYSDLLLPYINYFPEARDRGESLILFGDNGRGKTWGMLYALLSILSKGYSVIYIILRDLIRYINIALYGVDGLDSKRLKGEALEMLSLFKSVDLLIIDEASKVSSYTQNTLIQFEILVKERIANGLPVFVSTNHSPYEFLEHFGKQVMSAFIKHVYAAHFLVGADLRNYNNKKDGAFSYLPKKTQYVIEGDNDKYDFSIDSPVPLRRLKKKMKQREEKFDFANTQQEVIPINKVTGTRRKVSIEQLKEKYADKRLKRSPKS